jgi:hypothetical protein
MAPNQYKSDAQLDLPIKLDVNDVAEFLVEIMVNALGLLSSQKLPAVPDNVRQVCFHVPALPPLVHTTTGLSAILVVP